MADSKLVALLDDKLVQDRIIDKAYAADYKKVHKKLNSHVRNRGGVLTDELFAKGEEVLRSWLHVLSKQGASQEKLTSYLRCGLAHLCYDYVNSTYEAIGQDDLATRAFQSFKKRNYHKSFYRPVAGGERKVVAKKKVKSAANP